MTPEAQRIALAELGNWKDIRCEAGGNIPYGTPDDDFNRDVDEHRKHGQCGFPSEYHREELPDYLHDLNAIHELESILTPNAQVIYAWNLLKITGYDTPDFTLAHAGHVWNCTHASTLQRAEALLRTLGKWKEDE